MLICAAIFWGATTVVVKAGPLAKVSASKILLYQLAISALVLPFGSWVLNEPGVVNMSSLAIASLLFQTVWVASIGWFVLDEPLTIALLAALAMVAAGVYLVNR